jgi:hypothetical protein
MKHESIRIGAASLELDIADGWLKSLGDVSVGQVPLRGRTTRWLPWFDTYGGDVFDRFRLLGVDRDGDRLAVRTRAVSNPDVLFQERRDSSGDPCFRETGWDAPPRETDLSIVFEPVTETIAGRSFAGLRYWMEFDGGPIAIHRMVDRQSWELGGHLEDLTLVLRNWLTPPRVRLGPETAYNTAAMDHETGLMPGNLWGRWTLLPGFDMQHSPQGVLVGWFDNVSLIRTVVQTSRGEDALRFLDMHLFEASTKVRTNAKSILHCPDVLDDIDAMNLWTRLHDREQQRSASQFNIPYENAPAVVFSENRWIEIDLNTSYDDALQVAAEFEADYLFIDSVWKSMQTWKEDLEEGLTDETLRRRVTGQLKNDSMCATMDFEVADRLGGEPALKALCDRARERGVAILSWMACHYTPNSTLAWEGQGSDHVIAMKESGRHPDTGYAHSCWPINLHSPAGDRLREQLLGVCQRTGLAGFLWDSFSNIGWWQIDYAGGTMRPQHDKMAELYADLARAGLYLMPEAIVAFSAHSCCGLFAGDIYADDLLGYSYKTNIALWYGGGGHHNNLEVQVLAGREPLDKLFRCIAHKRVPAFNLHALPRDQWDPQAADGIREIIRCYKACRDDMVERTVCKDDLGVLYARDGRETVLFSFREQTREGTWQDVGTGETIVSGPLAAGRVYRRTDTD